MSQITDRKRVLWRRWLARGLSAFLLAWWLFIALVSTAMDDTAMTWESWVMASMVVTAVLATVAAWWRPRAGGTLMILFGVAFGIAAAFMAGRNHWIAVLTTGVPFVLIGSLFRFAWRDQEPPAPDPLGPPLKSGS